MFRNIFVLIKNIVEIDQLKWDTLYTLYVHSSIIIIKMEIFSDFFYQTILIIKRIYLMKIANIEIFSLVQIQ